MGRLLVGVGAGLVLLGLVVWLAERGAGSGWRLPGDVQFGGRGWRVYLPMATSILASLVLTVIANLVFWLIRRR